MKPANPSPMILVLTATLMVACSGVTDDTTVPTDVTVVTTTTVAEPPTTAVSATTLPTEVTSSTADNDEAEGSGCTPGDGDLPDGEWYGQVVSTSDDEIEFDLACWFVGDAAARAATEDGEESPPPNDYYIRNLNATVRTVAIGDDVMVVWYPDIGDPSSETTVGYSEWADAIDDRGEFTLGVWIEVEDGAISEIREQWVP